MYSNRAISVCLRVVHVLRQISSALSVLKQVWRNVKAMIAVRSHLMFPCSDSFYTIPAHQPANTVMTNIKT